MLRRGQRALRRDDRRSQRATGPGLDSRLPPRARSRGSFGAAGPISRSGSSCTSRSRRRRSTGSCRPRAELLRGMLGADYIGFHTGDYARHFRSSCLRVLGIESEPDTIELRRPHDRDRRRIRSGSTSRASATTLRDPETAVGRGRARGALRRPAARARRRAARLHEGDPAEARRVRALPRAGSRAAPTTMTMLQVLVPSRLESAEYRAKRDEIEVRIAHINGRFGQLGPRRRSSTSTGASRRPSSRRSTGAPT